MTRSPTIDPGEGFTPGPWAWSPNFTPGEDITGDLFGLGGEMVISNAFYEGMWLAADNQKRDAANARLIAAAPELYEALDAFVLQWMCDCNSPTLKDLAIKSRRALAKARGEA